MPHSFARLLLPLLSTTTMITATAAATTIITTTTANAASTATTIITTTTATTAPPPVLLIQVMERRGTYGLELQIAWDVNLFVHVGSRKRGRTKQILHHMGG